MSLVLGYAIAFVSFLVGLFIGSMIKTSGAESMVEQIIDMHQRKCKQCINNKE